MEIKMWNKERKYYTQEDVDKIIRETKLEMKQLFEIHEKRTGDALNRVFLNAEQQEPQDSWDKGIYFDRERHWRNIIQDSFNSVWLEYRRNYVCIISSEVDRQINDILSDEDLIKKLVERINEHQIK